jgi:hypothetical protein
MKRTTNTPRIILRSHPGITPEQACDARARAWAFVFCCWQKKGAETNSGGEDGLKSSHEMKGGHGDLEKNAIHGAEGDRTERTGKDKHGFVHR